MAARYILIRLFSITLTGLLAGCALLTPLPKKSTIEQRLAVFPTTNLPLKGKAVIHWNDHQIPFIEASNDEDLAFILGLVHAHLRLGQMDVMRRAAQGRLSEMGGLLAVDADHALRIINFGRGTKKIAANMPPHTKMWVNAFVRGLNYYQDKVRPLPHEYTVLGLKPEKWTVEDLLAVGRLAGSDVNWLVWWRVLKLRQRPDWPKIWARLLKAGGDSMTSFATKDDARYLSSVLRSTSKSGSNSYAVAGRHSKTGGALIASDPHLGIQFPNFWLVVGMKSPSYHAVGMMVPGLPFIAVGRNKRIAWGGTNMRAASSDLFDLSKVSPGKIKSRKERIRVRWWLDKTVTVRESPFGPVLSDAPSFKWKGKPFALRWVGHEVGDETTSMLKVARARNWREFRAAFKNFAVSAQNMIYADVDGNIGQVMATLLPIRGYKSPPDIILDPFDPMAKWRGFANVFDLPAAFNPEKGFVATANNKPANSRFAVGYFFSSDDRVRRISEVLGQRRKIGIDDLKRLQKDVQMRSAATLRDTLVNKIQALGVARSLDAKARAVLKLLREWDGYYRTESRGALAFELIYNSFVKRFTTRVYGEHVGAQITGFSMIKTMLVRDVAGADADAVREDLVAALGDAANRIADFKNWGDMHRLALTHPLAAIPVIGAKYRFGSFPVGGSTDTVMKTSHVTTNARHYTLYGQNARHISDLSDFDKNYFVLLGGQDGWFNSSTALDQMKMWRDGTYVQVPLRMETVRATFGTKIELRPGVAIR